MNSLGDKERGFYVDRRQDTSKISHQGHEERQKLKKFLKTTRDTGSTGG